MTCPLMQEIPYQDPWKIFIHFKDQEGAIFLDSAQQKEGCGEFSFIGIDPFLILKVKNSEIYLGNKKIVSRDPLGILLQKLSEFPLENHKNAPPFQGGAAGLFSYDLCAYLEKIPSGVDDMYFPDMAIGFYDLVIGFDHPKQKAWIFSSGYPETKDFTEQQKQARRRCDWLRNYFEKEKKYVISKIVCHHKDIHSNFITEKYLDAVKKTKNYILDGDIFQANISQRFSAILPSSLTAFDLYTRLRFFNPAPFAAYLHFSDFVIASASPERFIRLNERNVETRPIKGTRPRGKTLQEDSNNARELVHSAKDRSENIMIVDLMRNDISRVCMDHSVVVSQLCGLESYPSVHHLVSVVRGKIRENLNAIDLLRATFPGGSITGAPKIRAMEIIAEIEPTKRGPYCGSMGYIGFNGNMDTSILIRTFAIKNNIITFQAGGAIVLDSDPLQEFEETLAKASALKKALTEYNIYDFIN